MNTKLFSAAFVAFVLASCGGEPKENKQEEVTVETVEQQPSEELTEDFVLPSTLQIGELFKTSGLEYVSGLTLDPQKESSYNTTFDKYFAFGVYWTDMTYCVLNQKSQEGRKYMEVLKNLSNHLGAGELYNDRAFLERFDNNLDNQDSILGILIEIDEKTDAYVEDNDQQEMALVAFVGGWVEGMYLGVSTMDIEKHTSVTSRLIEQMVILDNLVKGLTPYEGSSKRLDKVIEELRSLYDFYIQIPAIANVEGSIMDVRVPSADMKVIGDKIMSIRALIVE